MNKKAKLLSIANKFDQKGLFKKADLIDSVVMKTAQMATSDFENVDEAMEMWHDRIESYKATAKQIYNLEDDIELAAEMATLIYPEAIKELLAGAIRQLEQGSLERDDILREYYPDFSEQDMDLYVEKMKELLSSI